MWSVAVVNLPNIGFKYTPNQLFWLAAAALSGATMRISYSFMVPMFGGRRWTTLKHGQPADPGHRPGLGGAEPGHQLHRPC